MPNRLKGRRQIIIIYIMVGSFVFILGLIAIIVGAIFIDGWVSWLVVIVGVILQALGKMFSQVEVTGKTDETILRLLFLASYIDGNNSEEENKYIQEYVKRRGLSEKQVKIIFAKAGKLTEPVAIPNDEDEKMRIIDEIVGVLKADGVVTDDEKDFLETIADMIKIDKSKALAKLK